MDDLGRIHNELFSTALVLPKTGGAQQIALKGSAIFFREFKQFSLHQEVYVEKYVDKIFV